MIAGGMPADEIAGLRSIFKTIDADGSGTITADELRKALEQKGSLLKKARTRAWQGGCMSPRRGARSIVAPCAQTLFPTVCSAPASWCCCRRRWRA